ncbi:MAG: DUF3060 domain-containing protein [Deltaproteobacteria bacterium]|nr:DUF3060 domain-containing protein [Deltaproteobacteria bacterium]MCW5808085.1 DUF3060 domain-containing protein [Deltaproteobacteria bacterium]
MNKLVFLVLLAASPALADVRYVDNNKKVKHDCAKEPDTAILGNNIELTLEGVCNRVLVAGNSAKVQGTAKLVSIAGNKNTVDLDGAGELDVSGNFNTASWKQGLEKGKDPTVRNTGTNNKVTQVKK